ncbi:sensor histidine kinase, partial [Methylogaea oryzae]|uniref:sensor histidine kinase n=1 Tax=Methylogaea oryzae TaxID=1295382 RepID=UPI0012E0F19B
MFHADFPCGLFLRIPETGPADATRRSVLLEAVIGGRRIGLAGEWLSLPVGLLEGGAALSTDAEMIQAAFPAAPYRTALRLPVAEQGAFLLLAPEQPASPLPLATVFEPVLANFAKTLQLCRANAEITAGLRAEVERHRQTMLERERSQNLLTLVLDTIPARVFWKDRDGVFLGCNRAFARDAGVDEPSQLVGKTDYDMGWRAQAERYREDDRAVIESGQAKLYFEEQQPRDDGIFWLETSKIPLTGADGEIIGVLGTYEDITARKRIETELVRAKELAEQASQAKSEFLSRMSHELRTPLNAVLGFGQILADEEPDQPLTLDQKDCVEHIVNAGQHLLHLVNDILDLAKIEAGAIHLAPELIDIDELLQECLDIIRPQAAQRGISLIEPAPGGGTVSADRTRLRQVLLNLLSNAVKYNRPEGAIRVSVQPLAGKVRLAVEDTGQGMTPEQLSGLFEAFNRLGAERSGTEGAGIGLVITKRLVEAMGGSIGADSRAGVGSTFGS